MWYQLRATINRMHSTCVISLELRFTVCNLSRRSYDNNSPSPLIENRRPEMTVSLPKLLEYTNVFHLYKTNKYQAKQTDLYSLYPGIEPINGVTF